MTYNPGWYPDPSGAPSLRWWDGHLWTTHTAPPEAAALPTSTALTHQPEGSRALTNGRATKPLRRKPRSPAAVVTFGALWGVLMLVIWPSSPWLAIVVWALTFVSFFGARIQAKQWAEQGSRAPAPTHSD